MVVKAAADESASAQHVYKNPFRVYVCYVGLCSKCLAFQYMNVLLDSSNIYPVVRWTLGTINTTLEVSRCEQLIKYNELIFCQCIFINI